MCVFSVWLEGGRGYGVVTLGVEGGGRKTQCEKVKQMLGSKHNLFGARQETRWEHQTIGSRNTTKKFTFVHVLEISGTVSHLKALAVLYHQCL